MLLSKILQVANETEFLDKLGCALTDQLKVVSIFGNTGDGKSHTLNHVFFGGRQVFATSSGQTSCTVGSWAALDKHMGAMIVDTEGLLGITDTSAERTRLLLKILAISDVVIYRTRAERLHRDMFQFLHDASEAYRKYFRSELEQAKNRGNIRSACNELAPAVVVFHETQHTDLLSTTSSEFSAKLSSFPT